MSTSEELKKLRAARGQCKSFFTRLEAYFDASTDLEIEELEARECGLKAQYIKLQDIQLQILCIDDRDDESGPLEDRYFRLCATIRKRKQSLSQESEKSVGNLSAKKCLNLPAINIQPFDGRDISAFQSFLELFTAIIDKDSKLTSTEKMYYLRTLLKGEPLQIIEGLPAGDESYKSALQLLTKRYDNPSLLISKHINNLLDLQPLQRAAAPQLREITTRIRQQLAALKNLKQPVEHWDSILMCLVSRKLDPLTVRLFHSERDCASTMPLFSDLLEFLDKRAVSMEVSPMHSEKSKPKGVTLAGVVDHKQSAVSKHCNICNDSHRLFKCPKFVLMSVEKRLEHVNKNKHCVICLGIHSKPCRYSFKCGICKSKDHNTLLHVSDKRETFVEEHSMSSYFSQMSQPKVLLPTVKVLVNDAAGNKIIVRGLLDSGSQTSFITTKLLTKLGLQPFKCEKQILTLGNKLNKIDKAINISIHSLTQNFNINVTCSIVDKITSPLPQRQFDISKALIPKNIALADNEYNIPGEIHLLLGADIFFRVLQDGKIEGGPSDPIMLNTRFGYIISGDSFPCCNVATSLHAVVDTDLDHIVKKFWETEKVPEVFLESLPEHAHSERVFQESVTLQNNRFEVGLPLKASMSDINTSNSFAVALQRFYNLEKRLSKDPLYRKLYIEFIHEYLKLHHAKSINIGDNSTNTQPLYFLPHHAVLRTDKVTNKLRVVFDASAKSHNNPSLNDIQCNGPNVQNQLFDILIQFRTFNITLMCDIRHMFRQINIQPEHRVLQNILWRDSPEHPLQCLQLQTITYGLKSSTFLATRCLIELARRHQSAYPLASKAIISSTYVDDIICGASNYNEAVQLKNELVGLMALGSFELHKWSSNDGQLLESIPKEKLGLSQRDLDQELSIVKTLGLSYVTRDDVFELGGDMVTSPKKLTKRGVLSSVSRFFDPLGFAGPITVRAKLILQQIWQHNLEWDDPLPDSLTKAWLEFHSKISNMPKLIIPRNLQLSEADECALYGYCDASAEAYGCCIYAKITIAGVSQSYLLCSKSRIASLNSKLTIPKLELNGALLLAKLILKISKILPNIKTINLFSDSQIVLGWLNSSLHKLPAYVANRIKEIAANTANMIWHHTPGVLNPADILSRGVNPQELHNNKMWWQGPDYLQEIKTDCNSYTVKLEFPIQCNITENICHTITNNDNTLPLFTKYSSLHKMLRVTCYVLRFINKCKRIPNNVGNLTAKEFQSALNTAIRSVQSVHFYEEIKLLKNNKQVNSNLKSLYPFIDANGLLRVGGRLQNSDLPFAKKFPIILPNKCHLTKIIILNQHLSFLHGGLKLLLSTLSQKYHIVNGIREIKSVLHKCIICHRYKADSAKQLMGSLPRERVTPARAFERVGLDYCGPFEVKNSTVRRSLIRKGYVVVFVCFTTKALHLEIVSDMTTEAFLAALKRFISRRGLPSVIHCDNASTFKGANNKLHQLYQLHKNSSFQNNVLDLALTKGIIFKFIPAYSPNHGGLWETAVKSVKFHLKRVTGIKIFTYEQYQTILCQIESILNSRPLVALSNDTSDYSYLTPGHFLIGCAPTSYPEQNCIDIPANRLRLWRCCEQVRQHFWRAWSNEYLALLNKRTKWQKEYPNLKEGMLVLLRNPNTAPFQWPTGRISKVFTGLDTKVRVIEIRTADGKTHTRAVSKVIVLPIDD